MFKRRLDLEGKPITDPEKHEVSQSESKNSTEVQVRHYRVDQREEGLIVTEEANDVPQSLE